MEEKNVLLLGSSCYSLQYANRSNFHIETLNQRTEEMRARLDQLEQNINQVDQFYTYSSTNNGANTVLRGLDRDKILNNLKKRQQDYFNRKIAAAKRMQELMRKFRVILDKILKHEWIEPFLEPVDVVGLGLHDYYEVIEKPMDFSTIKSKMESKDSNGYRNIREICTDVRLIFKNAMKYNDEKNNVHVMAKSLLDRFDTQWLQILPKVNEEERKLKDEMEKDMQLAHEIQQSRKARDLFFELEFVDCQLEKLKEAILVKCRKMTTEEKKQLGSFIIKLSTENINKVLEIISQSNLNFEAFGETVELDIDAQTEATLWKLKCFVKEALNSQMKITQLSAANTNVNITTSTTKNAENNRIKRRKCDVSDSIAKNPRKKCKM